MQRTALHGWHLSWYRGGASARLLALQDADGRWGEAAWNRGWNSTEYLLERRLFRRRSTAEVSERDRKGGTVWTRFAFPTWWHYDVLRGLEYLRRASVALDERVSEVVALVASKRYGDGRWPLEVRYPGTLPIEIDEGDGQPSRWNTLRALRVLNWYSAGD